MAIYYVSPSGSDSNLGTKALPWQTIAKVVATITNDDTVYFRAGTYAPISGGWFCALNNISLLAYPGELPVWDGGAPITLTQTDVARDIWSASHSSGLNGFRNIYVNGVRSNRCIIPINSFGWGVGSTGYTSTAGALNGWANPSNIEFVYVRAWTESRVPVASSTATAITMPSAGFSTLKARVAQASNIFSALPDYVCNAYEVLTGGTNQRGNHYDNRTTNILYYQRRMWEDVANASIIIAGFLGTMLTITGDGCTVEGIGFQHNYTDIPGSTQGQIEQQGNTWYNSTYLPAATTPYGGSITPPAVVVLNGATNCTVAQCRFEHLGTPAIKIYGGAQRNNISGNVIFDVSSTGIFEGDPLEINPGIPTGFNTFSNNLISGFGQEFASACGMMSFYKTGSVYANNEVCNGCYTGESHGLGWGDASTIPNANNNNAYNNSKIHDLFRATYYRSTLEDGGGIYLNGFGTGNVVNSPIVYNLPLGDGFIHATYTDNGCCGVTINNLVCYATFGYAKANANVSPGNVYNGVWATPAEISGAILDIVNNTYNNINSVASPQTVRADLVAASGPQGAYKVAPPAPILNPTRLVRRFAANDGSFSNSTLIAKPQQQGTIAFWLSPFSDAGNYIGTIHHYTDASGINVDVLQQFLYLDDTFYSGFQITGSFYRIHPSQSGFVASNIPAMFVFEWDLTAGTQALYCNNVLMGSATGITATVPTFTVGLFGNDSFGAGPCGNLQGKCMWNVVLSATDRSKLKLVDPSLIQPSHLISYLPMVSATNETDLVSGDVYTPSGSVGTQVETTYVGVPGAPTSVWAINGTDATTIIWSPVVGATSYKVYKNGVVIYSGSNLSFLVIGQTNGQYYVTAVNAAGESSGSNIVLVVSSMLRSRSRKRKRMILG